ncbi:MAG: hypothetical protein QM650_12385 [Microlunatus sp.]
MTKLPGRWALTIRSPIGSIQAEMTFTIDGGIIDGTATGKGEIVELRNIRTEQTPSGEHVTWSQSITKPMRMNLDFDVTIRDDELNGHSRAGRLPRSTVTGRRVSD